MDRRTKRILALMKELEDKERAIRAAYEIWAGSELPENPEAKTAPEAYAYRVIGEMMKELKKGLEND